MSCSEVTHAAPHRLLRTVCISPACADCGTQLTKNLITKVLSFSSNCGQNFSLDVTTMLLVAWKNNIYSENTDSRIRKSGKGFLFHILKYSSIPSVTK